jgi:serine protease Do
VKTGDEEMKMKKTIVLFMLILSVWVLTGCSTIIDIGQSSETDGSTNTALTTEETTSNSTTTSPITESPTTYEEISIDMDQLKADVYAEVYERIYTELYNQIKADVIQDISEEYIETIYQDIQNDLLARIASGELDVEAVSVFDQLIQLGLTNARAVVGINNLNSDDVITSTGSGVIYKKDAQQYYVITNEHVINGADSIEVQFVDGSTIEAELLGVERLVDLAVLRFVSEDDYQTAPFGNSDTLHKGEFITAVGNPSGFNYFNTMTFGVVSGVDRYFDIDDDGTRDMFVNYIQHDAAINAGNSGGALFNMQGEIVGINTLKLVDYSIEGMGFAIPGSLVELIAGDIELYGYSNRKPMLGITFLDIEANKAIINRDGQVIPEHINQGFYIQEIVPGSSVDGYVLPGDIILQIGEIEIENTAQFVEEFSQYLVGDVIDIIVYRAGQTITLTGIELKGRE